MLKVYVAGKYSADNVLDVLKNIGHGRKVCADLFALGFSPFCPWHDADFIIHNPFHIFNTQSFRDYCLDWLKVSDVLYVISGATTSTGVLAEINLANELNIPIINNIIDLKAYRRNYEMDRCKNSIS